MAGRKRTVQADTPASEVGHRREAALAEWLFSDVTGTFSDLRARFPHKLKGTSADTLERFRAVLRVGLEAIEENDGEGIAAIANFAPALFGMETPNKAIVRAFKLVEHFVSGARSWDDETLLRNATWALFLLGPVDRRFAKLDPRALAEEARRYVSKTTRTGNVGRSMKGAPALLAWLMNETGAFGVKSVKAAQKKIERARERTAKPKKALAQ